MRELQFPALNTSPTMLTIALLCVVLATEDVSAQRFATGSAYSTPAGQSPSAEMLREVSIEQRLNELLPLEATVRDESGERKTLGEYFGKKPVVLALVQFRCPMLCTQVLNGFVKANYSIPMEVGRDFEFVAVSFDTRETPSIASNKKRQYVRSVRRPFAADGLHFLTADQDSIDSITRAVGFHYRYESRSDQFAHASGIVLATPDGHLARYFYGIEYSPSDLRLGLVEASSGRIGTITDQVLLLCYHYDPLTGRYGLVISRLICGAGLLTVSILAVYLGLMIRREMRKPKLTRADEYRPNVMAHCPTRVEGGPP